MSLLDYERAFVRVLFGAPQHAQDAEALGDPARVALYRGMAQRRMLGQARTAYRASHAAMGEARFAACFARYLCDAPPRSSALRDAVADFAGYAAGGACAQDDAAPWLGALLALEALLFRCAYLDAPHDPRLAGELAFERPPLFVRPLGVLRAAYPVQRLLAPAAPPELAPSPTVLWVYRDADDAVRWRVTSPLLAQVGELAAARPTESLTALVQAAAVLVGQSLDEGLLAELVDGLTSAVAAGVLRGSASEG